MEQNIKQANIATNIAYIMADISESALLDLDKACKNADKMLRHEERRNFNAAIAALKRLKQPVKDCPECVQEDFGDDSDCIYQVIKLLIDRCGDDNGKLFQFYNYIKSFPSKMGMDLADGERIAFGIKSIKK